MSYPLVTKFPYEVKNQQYKFKNKIRAGMQSETEESFKNGEREVFIDFRKDPEGEFVLKLRNLKETDPEVKERVKPLDDDNYNVLMIFIDTLSRANFHRKYHQTKELLQKYHYLKKKKLRAYEYFRLHSIRGYTFPNLFASTYGVPYADSWTNDHLKRIDHYAKEKGYIVGMTSDCCTYTESETKCNKNPSKVDPREQACLQLQ